MTRSALVWDQFGLHHYPDLALVAVGGYGRGELHPPDILVVSSGALPTALGETIGSYLTLLWDLRLEVGHAVRTIKECIQQGEQDITIATNLIGAD